MPSAEETPRITNRKEILGRQKTPPRISMFRFRKSNRSQQRLLREDFLSFDLENRRRFSERNSKVSEDAAKNFYVSIGRTAGGSPCKV